MACKDVELYQGGNSVLSYCTKHNTTWYVCIDGIQILKKNGAKVICTVINIAKENALLDDRNIKHHDCPCIRRIERNLSK